MPDFSTETPNIVAVAPALPPITPTAAPPAPDQAPQPPPAPEPPAATADAAEDTAPLFAQPRRKAAPDSFAANPKQEEAVVKVLLGTAAVIILIVWIFLQLPPR